MTKNQVSVALIADFTLPCEVCDLEGSSECEDCPAKPKPQPIYDEREIFTNCTVEIWRNSKTGETSMGWWKNV